MGKYANIKIEYYIISHKQELVNRFCENNFQKRKRIVRTTLNSTDNICYMQLIQA